MTCYRENFSLKKKKRNLIIAEVEKTMFFKIEIKFSVS